MGYIVLDVCAVRIFDPSDSTYRRSYSLRCGKRIEERN